MAEHISCEHRNDWVGTLSTMVAAPLYIFYPYRLHVAGSDAVVEAWKRLITLPSSKGSSDLPFKEKMYVDEDSVVRIVERAFITESGLISETTTIAIFEFDDDKISCEKVFFDVAATFYVDQVFDSAFRSLPGVETF